MNKIESQIIDLQRFTNQALSEKDAIINHPLNRTKIPELKRTALALKFPRGASPQKIASIRAKAQTRQEAKIDQQFLSLVQTCYQTYVHSAQSGLGIKVLGDENLRKNTEYLNIYGALSTNAPELPSRFTLSGDVSSTRGGILSDSDWSIFKNDAVMLGTIHGFQTVYIDGDPDKLKKSFFYDENSGRLRLVGREIVMLIAGGYKLIKNDHFGYVFGCYDREAAQRATIPALLRAVGKIHTSNDLNALVKSNTISLGKWNRQYNDEE